MNHWHEPRADELTPAEADWLLEPGSLTARIRSRCGEAFHLDVVREVRAMPEEVPACWSAARSEPRLREVTLNCGDTAMIFARTLIPDVATVNDEWLLALGNKPLGDVLFQAGGERENTFEICRLLPDDELWKAAARQRADLSVNLMREAIYESAAIWARRSWVRLHGERLLICECFLPGLI